MKNLPKVVTEILPASNTKKSVQICYVLIEKFVYMKFSAYLENRIFSGFADDRIKPCVANYMCLGFYHFNY